MAFTEIIKNTKIDFVGQRRVAFIISTVLVLLGLVGFVMVSMGKANMSVDFTGGTNLHIKFDRIIPTADLRNALSAGGLKDIQIQRISGTREFIIKTKMSDSKDERTQDRVSRSLTTNLQAKFEILGANMVEPSVGESLKRNAIIAIVLALVCIIIYIAWRFTFIFGIAATIATLHDVLVLLGVFYLLGREMNILFITALLTTAGYSLTDTVVVFDRIRENRAKMKSREDFGDIINASINEVLSRTIITSVTTLLAIGAILVLGGEVLFDFSLALFIGVLIGTYSSVFVASPLIFLWRSKAV
ncbi:MAG TPA: protein translocase subunit SecF [Deltaproteobacteria bacterium]|nr:protein translocase subunit SecF [Deltaproteobacteria bacterium]